MSPSAGGAARTTPLPGAPAADRRPRRLSDTADAKLRGLLYAGKPNWALLAGLNPR